MLVLLIQSAYGLLTCSSPSSEYNSIDIIIRTSSAALFGYFLSGNFIRRSSVNEEPLDNSPQGPLISADLASKETDTAGKTIIRDHTSSRLQILIATFICLFCLLVLIVIRDTTGMPAGLSANSPTTPTVTQFRDFISGCVGFLIGCPTSESKH